jgi:hypothetical protein
MAQPKIIQEGLDRVESVVRTFERDWKRLQKQADRRRRDIEKRAERQVKRLQEELRKNPVLQRAQNLRSDAVRVVGEQVDALLGTLRIASHGDVERLERKVGQLHRKVRELEKKQDTEAAA